MTAHRQTDEHDRTLRQAREPYVALTLVCLAGPLIWVLHFAVVYLAEGFVCARPAWPASWVAWIVGVATLSLGAACLWLVVDPDYWLNRAGADRVSMEVRRFLSQFTRWMAALSLLAMAWVGSGVLMVGACQSAY